MQTISAASWARKALAVFVASVFSTLSLLGDISMATPDPTDSTSPADKKCEGGVSASEATPPGPATTETAVCTAKPADTAPGPKEGKKPKGHPAPHPGEHWRGYATIPGGFSAQGVYGALNVVDPAVPRGTNDYVAQRFLAKNCDGANRWLEVGWAEVGWRGDAQYVYTFNSITNTWNFFDQYPIAPGARIYTQIYDWGNTWQAWLWWNGGWQVLDTVSMDGLNCIENFVEPFSPNEMHLSFPAIRSGDGSPGGVQLANFNGTFLTWDQAISTGQYTGYGSSYRTRSRALFYDFDVWGANSSPVMSFYVNPREGIAGVTEFSASLSGTYDPDGDPLSYEVYWGDGTSSTGLSSTHTYLAAGTYRVTGQVCENIDTFRCSSLSETVDVCATSCVSPCTVACPEPPVNPCDEDPADMACYVGVSETGDVTVPSTLDDAGAVMTSSGGYRPGNCGTEGCNNEGAVTPSNVIGEDNRQRITNTTGWPYRSVVHIETSNNGRCTGFLISADTVATAGHCVFTKGNGWSKGVKVFPGRNRDTKPYGSCGKKKSWASQQWRDFFNRRFDFGAIKLDCNIGNRVGFWGYRWETGDMTGQLSRVVAYSGDGDTGIFEPIGTMYQSQDEIRRTERRQLFYWTDVEGGGSGAPIYNDFLCAPFPCAIAIHAYGPYGDPATGGEYNRGTRITQGVARALTAWINRA